jgi:competence CoiA-like predicted nuclease
MNNYDMTEWHKNWQKAFPIECNEVYLENNGEVHRADVLIEKRKVVIEFQHSPMSGEEFEKRNAFYKSQCGMVYNGVTEQDTNKNKQKRKVNKNEENRSICRRQQFLLHTEEAWLGG